MVQQKVFLKRAAITMTTPVLAKRLETLSANRIPLFTRCGCIGKSGPARDLSTAREGHMVEMLLPNREKLVKCTL